MQTTARTIIKKSLRLIGAIDPDEEPSNDEYTDCYDSLKTMMDSWGLEKMMEGNESLLSHPILSGVQSFTVGASADYVMADPLNFVNYVFAGNGDINYEIGVADSREEFDDVKMKSLTGWPMIAYYSNHVQGTSNGKLEFSCPFPEATTISFGVSTGSGHFTGLDAAIELPAGLKRAIETNFAIEISPEFQLQPSDAVVRAAIQSKAAFKLFNLEVPKLEYPHELHDQRGFDFVSG